jgi:uncharacterized membrane protein YfcA
MQLLVIALGGLAIGASMGLLGAGGTVVTVPLLLALGVAPKPAIATSLGVVALVAAAAALAHARAGQVDWRAAALFGPATALGGFAAGRAAGRIDGEILLLGFAALLIGPALMMLRPMPLRAAPRRGAPGRGARRVRLAATGGAIGALAGLVGAGGGFLFVPALALLGGLSMRRAVGTSLVVIALNALAALAGHLGHVALELRLAVPLCGAALAGTAVAMRLGGRAPEAGLRRAFGGVLLLIAAWMLVRSPALRALVAA